MNSGISLFFKTAFLSDVTTTSSLRSVVKVLLGHITLFFSYSDCQDDSCQKLSNVLNLSNLGPKYSRFFFFGGGARCICAFGMISYQEKCSAT